MQIEVFDNLNGGSGFIEAVKVNARSAPVQKFSALLAGVVNAVFGNGGVVLAQDVQLGRHDAGDGGAAELSEALDLPSRQDGKNAGKDGNVHSQPVADIIAKFKIVAVVKKKLRQDKFGASRRFGLEIVPIGVFSFPASDVAFGKTGDADGKTAVRANQFHQLIRIFEASFRGAELACSGRRVAAQGQNVADSGVAGFFQIAAQLRLGRVDASKVRHGDQPMLFLDFLNNAQSFAAGTAAGAISYRAIIRAKRCQFGDSFIQENLLSFFRFWGEKFDGNDRPPRLFCLMMNVPNVIHPSGKSSGAARKDKLPPIEATFDKRSGGKMPQN